MSACWPLLAYAGIIGYLSPFGNRGYRLSEVDLPMQNSAHNASNCR